MNEQPKLTANIRVGHEENKVRGPGMAPVSICAKSPTKQVPVSYQGLGWKRCAPECVEATWFSHTRLLGDGMGISLVQSRLFGGKGSFRQ